MKNTLSTLGMILLLCISSVSLTSCNNDGCTDPNALNFDDKADENDGSCEYAPATLMLNTDAKFGSEALVIGNEYTLMSGRKISFDILRFYMSNFRLVSATGETSLEDVYRQWSPEKSEMDLGTVPAGNYTALKFDVGVDDASNTGDPASWPDDHALSSSSATFDHWNWSSGYLFMKVEGKVDGSDPMDGVAADDLRWHIGTSASRRTITIPVDLTIAEGGSGEVHIGVDAMEFFHLLDVTQASDRVTHTNDNMPLAEHIANHFADAIIAQ